MNLSFSLQRIMVSYGIPFLMIFGLSLLAKSNLFLTLPNRLSFAITFDFLVTVPLVYFLLIRKTTIPRFTVCIFIFAGVLFASLTIPEQHQIFLSLAKKWMLPFLEFLILIIVLTKLFLQIGKVKDTNDKNDFYLLIKTSMGNLFPGKINAWVVTEIAVFYYGFIKWKIRKPKMHEFTYHKKSGILYLVGTLIFLISIESIILHLLIERVNTTMAWILTAISVYTVVQIFGFMKSITQRYSSIENGFVKLRYGILCEATIEINNIKDLEFSSSDIPSGSLAKKFSPFGNLEGHNIIIKLLEKNSMTRPYGVEVNFEELAVFIDDKEGFKAQIDGYLNKPKSR